MHFANAFVIEQQCDRYVIKYDINGIRIVKVIKISVIHEMLIYSFWFLLELATR